MVAIAGLAGRHDRPDARDAAATLARALPFHGPRDVHLDEGRFQGLCTRADRGPQPAVARSAGGVSVLAASRFDARRELADTLGTPPEASDADLLLAAYACWGSRLVEHIAGDFCFLLWDARERLLLAATDQFGARPLFYRETGEGLTISNAVTALRDGSGAAIELDEGSIAETLAVGRIIDPTATMYRNIRRLPAAHLLQWRDGALSIARYWSPPVAGPLYYRSRAALADEFRALFLRAVEDRMPAQGPIGILLSGGMDSAAVAAAARHALSAEEAAARIRGYTVYFRDFPEEERHYAGLVVQHLGIAQTLIAAEDCLRRTVITRRDFLPPEPGTDLDTTPAGQASLAVAREGGTLLGGVGGDPLLGAPGSPLTAMLNQEGRWMPARLIRSRQLYGRIPAPGLRSFLAWHRRPSRHLPDWIRQDFAKRVGLADRIDAADRAFWQARAERLPGAQWSELLGKGAPSHSRLTLEAGSPFCDTRLLAFALRLPEPVLRGKQVLRDAMAPLLPAEIVRRPKTPLGLATLKMVGEPVVVERILAAMASAPGIGDYVDMERFRATAASPTPPDAFRIMAAESFFHWFAHWQDARPGG